LTRPILELLGVTMETPLKITTDGKSPVISPLPSTDHDAKVQAAVQRINKKLATVLKRLAE